MLHPTTDRLLVTLIQKSFQDDECLDADAWNALLTRASFHGVGPLLARALEAPPRVVVPPAVRETLRDQSRRSALATASAYHELETLFEIFASDDLPIVLLKGAAVARQLYPEPALRTFGDLDLLIHKKDTPRLSELLYARGYATTREFADGFRRAYQSENSFQRREPPRTTIDLHWELVIPMFYRQRMSLAWFWKHTASFEFGAARVLIFEPTAQLAYLAIHASLHHRNAPKLIWLYDLHLLLGKYANEIDWRALAAYARQCSLTRVITNVLQQTQEWWGSELPRAYWNYFHTTRVDVRERVAFTFLTASKNEAVVLTDAFFTPGILHKLRYGLRNLFPNAAYMRERYHIQHDAMLPLYYARRFATSITQVTRSLWSVARNYFGTREHKGGHIGLVRSVHETTR